jgi:hypothetical protein
MRADVAVGAFTFTPVLAGRCAFLFLCFLCHLPSPVGFSRFTDLRAGQGSSSHDHPKLSPGGRHRIFLRIAPVALPPPNEPNKTLAVVKIVGGCGALVPIEVGCTGGENGGRGDLNSLRRLTSPFRIFTLTSSRDRHTISTICRRHYPLKPAWEKGFGPTRRKISCRISPGSPSCPR